MCVCVCVCVCVYVCVHVFILLPWWLLLSGRCLKHTSGARIKDLGLWIVIWCFCQAPSSPYRKMSYFTFKDENSSQHELERKRYNIYCWYKETYTNIQKQPPRGVPRKKCSENMQQIYRRTPMPKCDFNKVAKQLYWNCTSAWVFSCKFTAYFQNIFP